MHELADAIRQVTCRMQQAVDQGRRPRELDANDLIDVLLAIADELDPPLAEVVAMADACPGCGQRDPNGLAWTNDTVRCARCGTIYRPGR